MVTQNQVNSTPYYLKFTSTAEEDSTSVLISRAEKILQHEFQHSAVFVHIFLANSGGRSQNTILLASTQAAIKGIVQYSTRAEQSSSRKARRQDRRVSRPVE